VVHIVDGALAGEVVAGGAVLAVGGLAMGLRSLDLERIPAAGLLAATFFTASLIHVPLGPSSVHLIMNGLAGLVLGWAAFPALFVGLLLQAVFFGFGGVTVLGVNTVAIALPAVLVGLAARPLLGRLTPSAAALVGGLAGGGAIAGTAVLVAGALALSGEAFVPAAKLVLVAHAPVVLVEAFVCAAAVVLIRKVKPELFGVAPTPLVEVARA
jgi:cobalt/nickel transport system permease protein